MCTLPLVLLALAGLDRRAAAATPEEIAAGRLLFENETFGGNGRTCATCHVLALSGGMPPSNVALRFQTFRETFDPLFIAEPEMNLNTLTISSSVAFATGAVLNGVGAGGQPARAKVVARTSNTVYLVSGGIVPAFAPGSTVSDGSQSASVVSIQVGDLQNLEAPARMRDPSARAADFPAGRALILENVDDSFAPSSHVFRKSPHLQDLRNSSPYGFNNLLDLEEFTTAAVVQHFTRTMQRRPGIDFRLPTAQELALMKAFMLSLESIPDEGGVPEIAPVKFNLDRFARTVIQREGRAIFEGAGECGICHETNTLSGTAFATGVANQLINGPAPGGDDLPTEPPGGTFGQSNRPIATPGLFNVKNNGPFFHDNSARDLEQVIRFYMSDTFQNSPAGLTRNVTVTENDIPKLVAFLEGLVNRPYSVKEGSVDLTRTGRILDFGAVPTVGGAAVKFITVKNTSSADIVFPSPACRMTGLPGQTPDQFPFVDCTALHGQTLQPNQSRTIVVQFDPTTDGAKSAILEILAPDPTGVDLAGTGVAATSVNQTFSVDSAGPPPGWTLIRGGSFSVSAGQLRLASCTTCQDPNGNILIHDFTLGHSFTLTAKGIATATSNAWNDFSVIFNFQNELNYYFASFNESNDSQTNGIFKVVNGQSTQIAGFGSNTTAPGDGSAALHPIRVEKIRSTIRVYRGNTLLGSAVDTTFQAGQAGLGSRNDAARFDDFLVRTHLLGEDFTASTPLIPFGTLGAGTFTLAPAPEGKLKLINPGSDSPNGNIAVHDTQLPSGSFELFVNAHALSNSGSSWDDFSVIFNFSAPGSYYFASFNESDNSDTNGIFKVVNGVVTQLGDFGSSTTAPGAPRSIRIQRTGSTIRVLRDDAQIGPTVTDSTFNGGKVGIGSRNDPGIFDNLFVELP